jgi:hypothetical protein
MQITMRINLILSSSKCSAIDIPDVDITMSENKQSRYNNYVDISLHGSAEPVFIIKNKLVFLRESNPGKKIIILYG